MKTTRDKRNSHVVLGLRSLAGKISDTGDVERDTQGISVGVANDASLLGNGFLVRFVCVALYVPNGFRGIKAWRT